MRIGVAHATSEQDLGVIEQVGFAVLDRFHLGKKPAELHHLIVLEFK